MKVVGNEHANKLLEWSIQGDDFIDSDADQYAPIVFLALSCDAPVDNTLLIPVESKTLAVNEEKADYRNFMSGRT